MRIIESPSLYDKPSHPGHVRVLTNSQLEHAPRDNMEHNIMDPYTFMCKVHSKWSHAILDDTNIDASCYHYLSITNSMCPLEQPLPAAITAEQKRYHHKIYQDLREHFYSCRHRFVGSNYFCGNNAEHKLADLQYAEGLNAQLDIHRHAPPDIVLQVDPEDDTDDDMSIIPIADPRLHIVKTTLADQDTDNDNASDDDFDMVDAPQINNVLPESSAHNSIVDSIPSDYSPRSPPGSIASNYKFQCLDSDDETTTSLQELIDRVTHSRAIRLAIDADEQEAANALIQSIMEKDDECLPSKNIAIDNEEPIYNIKSSTHSYSTPTRIVSIDTDLQKKEFLRKIAANAAEIYHIQITIDRLNQTQAELTAELEAMSHQTKHSTPTRPRILVTNVQPIATFATSEDNLNLTDAQK